MCSVEKCHQLQKLSLILIFIFTSTPRSPALYTLFTHRAFSLLSHIDFSSVLYNNSLQVHHKGGTTLCPRSTTTKPKLYQTKTTIKLSILSIYLSIKRTTSLGWLSCTCIHSRLRYIDVQGKAPYAL